MASHSQSPFTNVTSSLWESLITPVWCPGTLIYPAGLLPPAEGVRWLWSPGAHTRLQPLSLHGFGFVPMVFLLPELRESRTSGRWNHLPWFCDRHFPLPPSPNQEPQASSGIISWSGLDAAIIVSTGAAVTVYPATSQTEKDGRLKQSSRGKQTIFLPFKD